MLNTGLQLGVERLLKLREVSVKVQYFGGEGMDRSQMLRALKARIEIGPTGSCQLHFLGAEEPTSSLYHPG